MKKIILPIALWLLCLAPQVNATGALPVFSANGFICGKEGITVTCKGTLPGGNGTVTSTGHDLVYLTVNIQQEGKPTRYTYFSDTGCLIGYTFGASGEPQEAVASHRGGTKKTFNLSDGRFEKLVEFCTPEQGTAQAAAPAAPEKSEAPAAKEPPTAVVPKAATTPAKPAASAVTAKKAPAPKAP